MPYDFDLFVIGGGSGGVRAARFAAGLGAKVAVCEERYWGGTCVNVGCVPKKLLVFAAHYAEDLGDAAGFGWNIGDCTHSWSTLIENKDTEIRRLNTAYLRMLANAGARSINGRGVVIDAHTVEVGGERFTARHILIATGGKPWVPDVPGAELGITSDGAFYLPERPGRVVIVGGGYIGVEFAGIFNGLGSKTTLVQRGKEILSGFDDEIRAHLCSEMRKKGVDVRTSTPFYGIERHGDELIAHLEGESIHCDTVMFATGRRPNTAGIGLPELGVELDTHGGIRVDDRWRSAVPSILAVGDVTNHIALTPVALEEGMQLAKNLFAGEDRGLDYELIPSAVFSTPNLATVGLTEAQAKTRHDNVVAYTSSFRSMRHTMGHRSERAFMKLLVDDDTDRVLGCHMVGPDAGEIIQGLAVALRCGATKAQFDATVGVHPTAAEEFVTMRTPRD